MDYALVQKSIRWPCQQSSLQLTSLPVSYLLWYLCLERGYLGTWIFEHSNGSREEGYPR